MIPKYENINKLEFDNLQKSIINKIYFSYLNFFNLNMNTIVEVKKDFISDDNKQNEKFFITNFFKEFKLDFSSSSIIDNVDEEKVVNFLDESLLKDLKKYIEITYDFSNRIDNNDVIYTINYKNNPLFLLKDAKVNFDLDTNEYDAIIKKLKYFNLINISNNLQFKKDLTGNFLDLMQKNNQVNLSSNYLSLSSNKNDLNINISKQLKDFNVYEHNLLASLNENKNNDINFLQNKYGILQSIYYYNQNINSLVNNYFDKSLLVNNSDDIVVLWENDKTLEPTFYGELLGNKKEINSPLNNPYQHTVYSSKEELNSAKKNILKLKPIQVYIVKDHFNNIINYQTFDPNQFINKSISDGYGTNEEITYQNTLNKINLYADTNYLFYEDTIIKNEVNKLYSLTFEKSLTKNINNLTYTFTKYSDMYSYLYDYVKLNSVNIY